MKRCESQFQNKDYIKKLDIAFMEGEGTIIPEPTWEQLENALAGFDTNKVGRVTISNPKESISMVIHGQQGLYHIGICEKESTFHYYWNGIEATGETVDIAWNIFDEHQICHDYETLLRIAEYFYETGKRCEDVKWESEQL